MSENFKFNCLPGWFHRNEIALNKPNNLVNANNIQRFMIKFWQTLPPQFKQSLPDQLLEIRSDNHRDLDMINLAIVDIVKSIFQLILDFPTEELTENTVRQLAAIFDTPIELGLIKSWNLYMINSPKKRPLSFNNPISHVDIDLHSQSFYVQYFNLHLTNSCFTLNVNTYRTATIETLSDSDEASNSKQSAPTTPASQQVSSPQSHTKHNPVEAMGGLSLIVEAADSLDKTGQVITIQQQSSPLTRPVPSLAEMQVQLPNGPRRSRTFYIDLHHTMVALPAEMTRVPVTLPADFVNRNPNFVPIHADVAAVAAFTGEKLKTTATTTTKSSPTTAVPSSQAKSPAIQNIKPRTPRMETECHHIDWISATGATTNHSTKISAPVVSSSSSDHSSDNDTDDSVYEPSVSAGSLFESSDDLPLTDSKIKGAPIRFSSKQQEFCAIYYYRYMCVTAGNFNDHVKTAAFDLQGDMLFITAGITHSQLRERMRLTKENHIDHKSAIAIAAPALNEYYNHQLGTRFPLTAEVFKPNNADNPETIDCALKFARYSNNANYYEYHNRLAKCPSYGEYFKATRTPWNDHYKHFDYTNAHLRHSFTLTPIRSVSPDPVRLKRKSKNTRSIIKQLPSREPTSHSNSTTARQPRTILNFSNTAASTPATTHTSPTADTTASTTATTNHATTNPAVLAVATPLDTTTPPVPNGLYHFYQFIRNRPTTTANYGYLICSNLPPPSPLLLKSLMLSRTAVWITLRESCAEIVSGPFPAVQPDNLILPSCVKMTETLAGWGLTATEPLPLSVRNIRVLCKITDIHCTYYLICNDTSISVPWTIESSLTETITHDGSLTIFVSHTPQGTRHQVYPPADSMYI